MANILDIRRRIRSVNNTRQITKAMKMVSAAKLRRAQERALAARPYAQMLTNVLKSLVSRAEIYDPETGEPRHPLLAERPEKTVLLIVVTGDKGLAGAFNANILKAAQQFHRHQNGQEHRHWSPSAARGAISCGDAIRERGRARVAEMAEGAAAENPVERAGRVEIVGEHVGVLEQARIQPGVVNLAEQRGRSATPGARSMRCTCSTTNSSR